jgi:hypothetical protein
MQTYHFSGTELFSIRSRAPFAGGLAGADLQFKPRSRSRLGGAGLYAITWGAEERLIYLGMYRGTKTALHGGCVVRARWWAHVSGLSARGHKLSLSKRGIAQVSESFADRTEHGFVALRAAVLAANPDVLARDRGCQSTVQRMAFAAREYELFASLGEGTEAALDNFRFTYVQLEPHDVNGRDPTVIRELLMGAESELIERFAPPTNGTGTRSHNVAFDPRDVVPAMQETLARWLANPGVGNS